MYLRTQKDNTKLKINYKNMRTILIILFAVLSVNNAQAQPDEPKNKNFLGPLSFKENEVFKRIGAFSSANVLYYHSNFGIGLDCFLIKNISINIEIAAGDSYGQEKGVYISDKYFNGKVCIGLKYWPITMKTNNNIYPYFGANLASTFVHFETRTEWETDELSVRASSVIETPIGLCYYKDGFQLAAHVGVFMDWHQDFNTLLPRYIYPFMSLIVGYRF